MITIAFLALILTVTMQSFRLQRAAVREEFLRAEAAAQAAAAERNYQRARAALDQMLNHGQQR